MPVHLGVIKEGEQLLFFYQYGKKGKRYFFNPDSKESKLLAYEKAIDQGIAIKTSQLKRGLKLK